MAAVIARLTGEMRSAWEASVRGEGSAQPQQAAALNPLQPVSAFESDVENAIGLVRRGVRVVPFAEALPLVPLYRARGEELPAELRVAHEQQGYEFLLVSLTFTLSLDADEAPDSAEFTLALRDTIAGARGARAIRVFPQREHSSWFRTEARFNVDLDAKLSFSASTPAVGQAKAEVTSGVKVIAGPFQIELGQTELEVLGEGDREIGWRYRVKRALAGRNDYRSWLVLKVAKEETKLQVLANIGVRTYRRSWSTLWLRDKLPILYADAELDIELPGR